MTEEVREHVKAAIKDVRKGMGVRSAATKHGLSRETLRYYIQKANAEHVAFARVIREEKRGS